MAEPITKDWKSLLALTAPIVPTHKPEEKKWDEREIKPDADVGDWKSLLALTSPTPQVETQTRNVGGETALGKTIDVMSRPEYASASMARDYIMAKPFDLKSAFKGLKGETGYKVTYPDIVDEVFPHWGKGKKFAMGLAMSVMFDPTTYIPAKWASAPFEASKKALQKSKHAQKALAKVDSSALGKIFNPSAGLNKEYYDLKRKAQVALSAENSRMLKDIDDLMQMPSRRLDEDDAMLLSYAREHPEVIDRLGSELRGKLEDIGLRFDELLDKGVNDGLYSPEVAKKWLDKETPYVPHYYPGRGINIAQGEIPPTLFEKVKKPTFLKKRVFNTLEDAKTLSDDFLRISETNDIETIKALIKEKGLDGSFGDISKVSPEDISKQAKMLAGFYKPEENILKALAYRSLEQAGYTARKKFVDKVLRNFGEKVNPLMKVPLEGKGFYYPSGAIRFYGKEMIDPNAIKKLTDEFGEFIPAHELDQYVKKFPSITKNVPKYMLPDDIAKDLKSVKSIFYGDAVSNQVLGVMDKAQNVWKGMATAVRLPFHLRNMYSNWFQAYLSGIPSAKLPQRLLESARLQSGQIDALVLNGKRYPKELLQRKMEDLGVVGQGWMGADITRSNMKEIENILKDGKLKKLNPLTLGRKFGTAIENNSRVAVFIDQLSKGKSFDEAAQTTKKYLFDYTELTDFEKKVLKRALPFYTWSRKNIPLQIENVLRQPQKYQKYGKVQRAFSEPETKQDLKYKDKYFDEMLYVKSPFKTEGGKTLYMNIDMPPLELNRMSRASSWLSGLSPVYFMKPLIEAGFNFKTFPTVSQISKQPLEKTIAPVWVQFLPKKILSGMEKASVIGEININGKRVLGMDKKAVHVLQSYLPFLNEINRIHAQPILLSDESPIDRKKAYLTGIGHKSINKESIERRKFFKEKEYMTRELRFRFQHVNPPTERELKMLKKGLE